MVETIKLEKLISIISDVCSRHLMIKDFGFGQTDDIMNLSTPYIWIEPTGSIITSPYYQETIFVLDFYCMDRLNKGEDNWLETTSDTLYILHTLISDVAKNPDFIDLGLKIDGDVATEPMYEASDDNSNGHKATIRIKSQNRIAPCNSPIV